MAVTAEPRPKCVLLSRARNVRLSSSGTSLTVDAGVYDTNGRSSREITVRGSETVVNKFVIGAVARFFRFAHIRVGVNLVTTSQGGH